MYAQGEAKPSTTSKPPVITSLALAKLDTGQYRVIGCIRQGRRTVSYRCWTFEVDREGRPPADVDVSLWEFVQRPLEVVLDWEVPRLF